MASFLKALKDYVRCIFKHTIRSHFGPSHREVLQLGAITMALSIAICCTWVIFCNLTTELIGFVKMALWAGWLAAWLSVCRVCAGPLGH